MSFVAYPKQTHSEKGFLRNIIQPACLHAKLLQLYLTLCNPMDYNPPGSSVHGISQARILEWVAISFLDFVQYGPNSVMNPLRLEPLYEYALIAFSLKLSQVCCSGRHYLRKDLW